MQEEVNQKTVALSIRTTKLTGKVLAAALGKVVRALQKHHQKALTPQGRQSVKKLMNHYGGKNNYEKDRNSSIISGYFTGSNTSGQFKCICLREYRCKLYSTGSVYIYTGSMQYRVYINGEGGNFFGRT